MKVLLELNEKYGYGYQARMLYKGQESLIDDEPLMLGEITAGVMEAVKEINVIACTNYKAHEIIQIDGRALEINAKKDFASAQVLNDKTGRMARPVEEDEILLTGKGVLHTVYFAWKDENNAKSYEALRKYSQYLAIHGYGKRAHDIFKELIAMDDENANLWLESTYDKYVYNMQDMVNFILT